MKKKLIQSLIALIISLGVMCTSLVTYAWYTPDVGVAFDSTVEAIGVMVIYFSDEVDTTVGVLKPAIVKGGAIENDLVDTSRVYKSGEISDAPYIETGAQPMMFNTMLSYRDASISGSESQASALRLVLRYAAYIPDLEAPEDMNLGILLDDWDIDIEVGIEVGDEVIYPGSGGEFVLTGESDIYVNVTAYLAQVDALCNPAILERGVMIVIGFTGSAEGEDA